MSGRDRSLTTLAVLAGLALAAYTVLGLVVGEDFVIPATVVGGIAAAIVLRGPVGQALARRIQSQGDASELPPETVMAELDELRARVLELEERVDFSERLLAQAKQEETGGLP